MKICLTSKFFQIFYIGQMTDVVFDLYDKAFLLTLGWKDAFGTASSSNFWR